MSASTAEIVTATKREGPEAKSALRTPSSGDLLPILWAKVSTGFSSVGGLERGKSRSDQSTSPSAVGGDRETSLALTSGEAANPPRVEQTRNTK